MTAVFINFLKCGDYNCSREAKWFPTPWSMPASPAAAQQAAALAARCGIHGPGVAKRQKWGKPAVYVPLTKEDEPYGLALAYRVAEKQAQIEYNRKKADEQHERRRAIAVSKWKELDEEPDCVLQYVEDWRGRRVFRIVEQQLVDAAAAGDKEAKDRLDWGALITITLDDRQDYDDVTDPVDLNVSASSRITPKLAPLYAEALAKAADMANAMNARLRERHNDQTR